MARAERLDALLGEKGELAGLSSRTFFAETSSRAIRAPWSTARSRTWIRRAVPALALGLAVFLGAALGSGGFTLEGRYYQQQLTALEAPEESFVVPEVTGHPGAAAAERRHLIRQFMALDGAN